MNSELFQINTKKEKHIYVVRNDSTILDNLVIDIKKKLGEVILGVSVRGTTDAKNVFSFKQFPYGFKQKAKCSIAPSANMMNMRQYYLKLYVNFDKLPFKICNMDWVPASEGPNEADFNSNVNKAFNLIKNIFRVHVKFFMVSVFCGFIPQSSWSSRCYIKVIIKVPITPIDVFYHNCLGHLTDFGLNFKDDIKSEFCQIISEHSVDLLDLSDNKNVRASLVRKAENITRKKIGLKDVGDAYVNETLLANITKKIFPDAIRQYRANWLGKFILDIYVPSRNLAIEYHGEQHFKPIERFGGAEKLLRQQKRDESLRNKCQQCQVLLIEWHYTEKITEKKVFEEYSRYFKIEY